MSESPIARAFFKMLCEIRLSNDIHLVDSLFRYPGATLKVLFDVESNIRSNDYSLPRDKEIDVDPPTGLVKFSCYGETHKPMPDMLRGIDLIVFDIQELGARFYEHIDILGFVMEDATVNNIEVVVLDRPNLLRGNHRHGFLPDNDRRRSLNSSTNGPNRID